MSITNTATSPNPRTVSAAGGAPLAAMHHALDGAASPLPHDRRERLLAAPLTAVTFAAVPVAATPAVLELSVADAAVAADDTEALAAALQTGSASTSAAPAGASAGGCSLAVTMLASRGIALGDLVAVLGHLNAFPSRLHVLAIRSLSDPAAPAVTALDVVVAADAAAAGTDLVPLLRGYLRQIETARAVDIAVQRDSVFRRHKRLFVFDMDSTLIQQEVIDQIAAHAGVGDRVSRITESAMRGEIDFTESLRRRVALLKSLPASTLDVVREIITFSPGAKDLCRALKRLGCKMAVVSGGFIPLAKYVQATLGLDFAHANGLAVSADGAHLTGETYGPIVDGRRKAELLVQIAAEHGIPHDQVVAVGDGANDLLMMGAAGLGIAYNAKPKVQEQAAARINQPSLLNVLHIMGLSWAEIQELLA
ncbi:Phosphoserine phosphatase [Polyrhizophydium stewartii]|uniref:phosphoserine phosphatase n=1 Tax=Polyrhizophydium stewartii TaxID=2732419 RepID=A0ABR4N1S6_9FUNG|nr:hypothetical protein HK105_000283 [Polyrhizophydium stewartii]